MPKRSLSNSTSDGGGGGGRGGDGGSRSSPPPRLRARHRSSGGGELLRVPRRPSLQQQQYEDEVHEEEEEAGSSTSTNSTSSTSSTSTISSTRKRQSRGSLIATRPKFGLVAPLVTLLPGGDLVTGTEGGGGGGEEAIGSSRIHDGKYTFAGEEDEEEGSTESNEDGEREICDAQAVSINSGCLGGFPIGVGCAVSGEGGLAFAVQSEATSPGSGELILTGKIGKSMAESCMVALSWVKAKSNDIAAWMGLETVLVDLHRPDLDVHVNFPSCEAEKNGPSAGATVATSLVLLMSGAKLRPNVAISGEVNLRGYLLPIGNVKEKVAAASRQGITHIVLPSANIKQFRRLPTKARNSVKALKADHMLEVIKHAVEPPNPRTGFNPAYEAAVKHHAGMGITASLACSHVKGKVQWVECCATTGRGEWHITGNVQEGTRGSVLVARTWVRKNAQEIVSRLGGAAQIGVELCSMKGLGESWQGGNGGVGLGLLPSSSASSASSATTTTMQINGGEAAQSSSSTSFPTTTTTAATAAQAQTHSLSTPPLLDVHIHLPETEVAKDVSINGAAAAVSMIAVMTGLAVRPDVAVLGEITLAGVLWPLEQVNEAEVKTAIDANISHLILPMDNVRQIEKVPREMRKGLRVTGALRLMDVLDHLFVMEGEEGEGRNGEGDEMDVVESAGAGGPGGGEGEGKGGHGHGHGQGNGRSSKGLPTLARDSSAASGAGKAKANGEGKGSSAGKSECR